MVVRVQELMSGWLNAYDFAALLNPYLLPGQLTLDLRTADGSVYCL